MPTKTSAGLVDALKLLAVMPAAGAGIGGLIGAARAEKGKRLRTAVGDAGVGALAGLGFGLGGLSGGAAGMTLGSAGHPSVAEQNSAALGGAGSALGAVGAGMLGQKLRKEMEEEYDIGNNPLSVMTKINKDTTMKKMANALAQQKLSPEAQDMSQRVGLGVRYGGLAGLIGGGIHGAMAPGHYIDSSGKVKQRSKLMGALRGGLGYGALGAGIGGAAGGLSAGFGGAGSGKAEKPVAVRDGQIVVAVFDPETGERIGSNTADKVDMEKRNNENKPMKKKAFDDLQNVALGTSPQQAPTIGQGALAGAGIGGLIGALRAPKGKMLKYTLGGAGIGGLTGAGSTAAYRFHDSLNMPQPYNSLSRLPVTIGAGGLAAHLGNKMYDEVEGYIPEKKQDKKDDKKDKPMKKTEKKSAALSFGEKVAAGFDWKSILNSGLGGAALGAGVGGLAGLVAPGEDGQGRRRSRLSGALRGAMGGGLLGGGAGAIGEAASPGFGQSAYNYANDLYRQLFGRPNPVRGQQVASTAVPMPGGQQMRVHPGTKSMEQIQAERAPMMDAILNKPKETIDPIVIPGME